MGDNLKGNNTIMANLAYFELEPYSMSMLPSCSG